MPLTAIKFKPGIVKEVPSYAAKGGYVNCDKVRFRFGLPEKIGGWINQSIYTFKGVARTLFNWVTYTADNLLAFGTSQKYYVERGGQYYDITPIAATTALGAAPFATTNLSKYVVVTDANWSPSLGTFVTFSGAAAVAGLTLNGEYEIIQAISGSTYAIAATSTANATTTGGGAGVTAVYQLNAGNVVATAGNGWGAGGWGLSAWGAGSAPGVMSPLRLWTQNKSGENLIFAQRGGAMYYWVKDTSFATRGILLSAAANATVKTAKTLNAFVGGASTVTISSSDITGTLNISTGSVISGTNITAGTYVGPTWDGSTTLPLYLNGVPTTTAGVSAGTYSFSFSGRSIPNMVNQIDTSDINYFVIALGANPYDPTNFSTAFDPMLVRWSDQNQPFEWVPATTNQAGEERLSNGSYLVTSLNTRQETIIWSDAAVYSAQYLGPPYVWGFSLLMDNVSIASPNAVITINNMVYWMGTDEFYMYSGVVQALPCPIRRFVFENLNFDQIQQVVCGINEGYKEVWWFYPSSTSSVNDSYIIYNFQENVWTYGTIFRTAWLDSPLRPDIMGAYSVQNTFTSADVTSSITTIPVLNGNSYPNDGVVTIGSEQISYTGTNNGTALTDCVRGINGTTAASHTAYTPVTLLIPNQITLQEQGVDDGTISSSLQPIAAYIETADTEIGDGHNFIFVSRVIPDLTFTGSTVTNPQVVLTIKPRFSPGSAYQAGVDTMTVTNTVAPPTPPLSYPIEQYTEQVFTRIRGREAAFRIESTGLGVAWQMGVMRIDGRPDGRR